MKRILTDIIRLFDEGLPVVLATIIDQDGSTTRTAGGRMIVCGDGAICGTIGGGLLEAQVISRTLGLFKSWAMSLFSFDLGGEAIRHD